MEIDKNSTVLKYDKIKTKFKIAGSCKLNKEIREGWLNRHINGLPKNNTNIIILYDDIDGQHEIICNWKEYVFDENMENTKNEFLLGTATSIDIEIPKIGFHLWSCNNS